MKTNYTIREFHPVDGYFALIEKDGIMIAKTFNPADAKMIIDALGKGAIMSQYQYIFMFVGRHKGAIGTFHDCRQTVMADNEKEARLKLYDTHDHIQQCDLVRTNDPTLKGKKT